MNESKTPTPGEVSDITPTTPPYIKNLKLETLRQSLPDLFFTLTVKALQNHETGAHVPADEKISLDEVEKYFINANFPDYIQLTTEGITLKSNGKYPALVEKFIGILKQSEETSGSEAFGILSDFRSKLNKELCSHPSLLQAIVNSGTKTIKNILNI